MDVMASSFPRKVMTTWIDYLESHTKVNLLDDPNYYAASLDTLVTSSQPIKFSVGTGSQILSSTLTNCLNTKDELIIVTCFWAKSSSQEAVSSLLLKLSAQACSQNCKIQVRICFSSRSISQKLFQTSSLDGKIYPPSSWASLGLPSAEELHGLEMVVKSVFVRPFSVMHPKFILMDRQKAFMPSCNLSFENWFEGCIEMRGEFCEKLFEFWDAFWSRGGAQLPPLPSHGYPDTTSTPLPAGPDTRLINQIIISPTSPQVPTILLPSPHHINPHFRPPGVSHPPPPLTPLNTFLIHLFSTATQNIFIQTPNLTSAPVISALFSALERGIHIHLVTSRRLMVLEQLVTAGTITEIEVWKLRRRYRRLLRVYEKNGSDIEAQVQKPGALKVEHYLAKQGVRGDEEPVKSHLKMVIVDEEITVLGSGNMDRASWYTSQELGVAFFSREMAREIRGCLDEGLEGRVEYICQQSYLGNR
jgi:phosphatidylserine/phosphatidylglycerophosphate/cardiolipin synthase-like enzyme